MKRVVVGAHYGLRDWLAQRITAVLMAVYSVVLVFIVLAEAPLRYEAWRDLFSKGWMRVATLLFGVSLAWHMWVGVRDIIMDYVKPDGVRRGLTGEVLRRIEAKGYTLVRLELREATPELLAEHYAEHEGKPFYEPLVEFMLSGPVAAMVLEGERCIEGFRSLAGATDPTVAAPGTIRGDLGRDWGVAVQQNLVHGSDSPESAAREIGIWFPDL